MALPLPRTPGFSSMLKEGTRYFAGVEESILRNIEACTEFSKTMKTSYGPRGLNKMIINHLEKLFVTSDAATIIDQLEINHPAAKLIVQASKIMEHEVCLHFLSKLFCNFFLIISFLSLGRRWHKLCYSFCRCLT